MVAKVVLVLPRLDPLRRPEADEVVNERLVARGDGAEQGVGAAQRSLARPGPVAGAHLEELAPRAAGEHEVAPELVGVVPQEEVAEGEPLEGVDETLVERPRLVRVRPGRHRGDAVPSVVEQRVVDLGGRVHQSGPDVV